MVFASVRNLCSQWFPPAATFTGAEVPSQKGRVFIVTGGNSGVGFELCKLLYETGATIYMASRSKEKAESAIQAIIENAHPRNPGELKFLQLDLNDLESVKTAAATFATQEPKLDILWNNAGPGGNLVPKGSRTKQNLEPFIGAHCVAPLLFTELLLPQLKAAVTASAPGTTRVIWTSSFLAEGGTPANGIDLSVLSTGTADSTRDYAVAKAGNWFLAREYASRHSAEGIVSVAQNPGNLRSNAYQGTPWYQMAFIKPVLHEVRLGAYTELFAGLTADIGLQNNGAYVIPWGRIRGDEDCPRKDIIKALRSEEEGGLGYGKKFWDWCEEQWKPFCP